MSILNKQNRILLSTIMIFIIVFNMFFYANAHIHRARHIRPERSCSTCEMIERCEDVIRNLSAGMIIFACIFVISSKLIDSISVSNNSVYSTLVTQKVRIDS